jgi:hypothetical protein
MFLLYDYEKKNFYMMIVAAIAVVAAWNVSQSKNEMALTDVALENVEALAGTEDLEYTWYSDKDDDYDPDKHCYKQCVKDGTGCPYVYNYPYAC